MARENNVRLRGIVLKNPMIVTRGDVQVTTVILKVIRPDRAAGDNSGFAHSAMSFSCQVAISETISGS